MTAWVRHKKIIMVLLIIRKEFLMAKIAQCNRSLIMNLFSLSLNYKQLTTKMKITLNKTMKT